MPRRASPLVSLVRFLGRYAIAAAMIPVGVALGLGGLVQHAWRSKERSGRGLAPPRG